MKRKTNVRSYERRDGTPVKAHERSVEYSEGVPLVSSKDYKPPKRTVEVEVWTYDEAPEDVKQRIMEKYGDINVNYDWWEFTPDTFEEILKERKTGLSFKKLKGFDLDRRSEIDVDLSLRDRKEFLDWVVSKSKNDYKPLIKHINEKDKSFIFDLIKNGVEYRWSVLWDSEPEDLELNYGYKTSTANSVIRNTEQFDADVNELITDLEKEFFSILRSDYEYLVSEESVAETFEANDYLFDKYGDIIR
jgi:hypothetical protein